ncbi:hypothetical protein SAMN05216238_107125 [Lentibacillus persicus]|uniref:Uncharacterized protein n=1 Tax=Lentibacillus persicus TaxID=640948 RepID=A0A1I1X6H7_9BACI|nr:hypothetical protein SAMN05216238_107125 [Lentibacillus persicus]
MSSKTSLYASIIILVICLILFGYVVINYFLM